MKATIWILKCICFTFFLMTTVACAGDTEERSLGELQANTQHTGDEYSPDEDLKERIIQLEQQLAERDEKIKELTEEKLLVSVEEEDGIGPRLHYDLKGEDFYKQFWMNDEPSGAAEELGYFPGTIDWSEYNGGISSGFEVTNSDYTDVGTLVHQWVGEQALHYEWDELDELAIRIRYVNENTEDGVAESAEAIIFHWGLKDDSVRGLDYLLHLKESTAGKWYIESIEQRSHCGRGVSENGDICL